MSNQPASPADKPKWPVYPAPPLWYIQRGERFGK